MRLISASSGLEALWKPRFGHYYDVLFLTVILYTNLGCTILLPYLFSHNYTVLSNTPTLYKCHITNVGKQHILSYCPTTLDLPRYEWR